MVRTEKPTVTTLAIGDGKNFYFFCYFLFKIYTFLLIIKYKKGANDVNMIL